MDILIDIILLLAGFILLIKGADVFVDGSSSVAKLLKIPSIIVGLTIVSMGTSLPEMAVSITAAVQGENAIAVGNIVGSNFFNLMVVLGVCAVIKPVEVKSSILKREYPLNIIVTIVLLVFSADYLLFEGKLGAKGVFVNSNGNKIMGVLSRLNGGLLLLAFIMFIVVTVILALRARKEAQVLDGNLTKPMSVGKSMIFILVGIVAIKFGGDLVVDNAKSLALVCGMSDTLVGLTIVALGTSLPELVTSIVAARKGENDLAVGNVVGSNLFNILFVLGSSSLITPIAVTLFSIIDMGLLAIVSIIGYVLALRKRSLSRKDGIIMLLMYSSYLFYIIAR